MSNGYSVNSPLANLFTPTIALALWRGEQVPLYPSSFDSRIDTNANQNIHLYSSHFLDVLDLWFPCS